MKNFKRYFLVILASILLIGCQKSPAVKPAVKIERTTIIYMVADNNLSTYAQRNINAMESSFSEEHGGRILLFYNDVQGNCRIYDIHRDDDQRTITSPIIKEYKFKTNPCLPETLSNVIADCREYSKTDSYSLIFWSHGTGWLPQGMTPARVIKEENPSDVDHESAPQLTFGSIYSFTNQMEIYELADALPKDLVFDYINFDACLMAGIEIAYELRNSTRYFMASAAEILAEGYPYKDGLTPILQGDVGGMSRAFYNYYNAKSGVYRSATTVVVDCSKLENIALEMRKLVEKGGTIKTQQQFGRDLGTSANFTNLFWDLGEMATLTWGEEALNFHKALNEAIVYKNATAMLFQNDYYGEIVVNSFSGMTIYAPKLSQPKTFDIYRNNYDWAIDTELYKLAK